jgi:hypothetical protein
VHKQGEHLSADWIFRQGANPDPDLQDQLILPEYLVELIAIPTAHDSHASDVAYSSRLKRVII